MKELLLHSSKASTNCVYHDETLNLKAAEWVRENAFVKGRPNMSAQTFCDWINNSLLVSSHLPFLPKGNIATYSCSLAPPLRLQACQP